MENNELLWVEKYRPSTIKDVILPERLKNIFEQFVEKKEVPNLLLSGSAGVGKTTVAKALMNDLDYDYILINGSLDRNIDVLRNEIMQYISTVSLTGARKYVILDESDYLNINSTQPALRNMIEEYSGNCGFILTCNFKAKIIEPLHSRCSNIDFTFNAKEKMEMAKALFKRILFILDTEKVEYDKAVVSEIVKQHFPDARRIINELQKYSISGKIDTGILSNQLDANMSTLLKFMKDKDFKSVRKWIGENMDAETSVLFKNFYDHAYTYFTPQTVPALVLILAKYQYQDSLSADTEICRSAAMVEIMLDCEFVK